MIITFGNLVGIHESMLVALIHSVAAPDTGVNMQSLSNAAHDTNNSLHKLGTQWLVLIINN